MMQGGGAGDPASAVDGFGSQEDTNARKPILREYRDVRPSKKRFSFSGADEGGPTSSRKSSRSFSNPPYEVDKRRASGGAGKQGVPNSSADSVMERFARFVGADFGSEGSGSRGKQSSRS